ncbi:MAG: hypothetical protein QOF73_2574 [Thermomicrobiales bacterium]|nr:hypothetical protein [Thermomicrobiales bacterium]
MCRRSATGWEPEGGFDGGDGVLGVFVYAVDFAKAYAEGVRDDPDGGGAVGCEGEGSGASGSSQEAGAKASPART